MYEHAYNNTWITTCSYSSVILAQLF